MKSKSNLIYGKVFMEMLSQSDDFEMSKRDLKRFLGLKT
jgi:hypothetical protein